MRNPFKVGKEYRNRDGKYEVVELDAPHMVIQYSDGRLLETTVEMQARIWRNIRLDERAKQEAKERAERARLRRRRRNRRGRESEGLEESDFKDGVTGTSWRRRERFGGLLAQRLTDVTPHFFQSYTVYRQPEVHIVQPDHYKRKTKERSVRYVFSLDEEKATFGLYVEKKAGEMDERWHWPYFVDGLMEVQEEIEPALREHDVHWELREGEEGERVARVEPTEDGLLWKGSDEESELQWADFVERLRELDAEKRYSLYLCTSIEKSEALDAGDEVAEVYQKPKRTRRFKAQSNELAERVIEVYQALLPLYMVAVPGEG